MPTTTTNFGFTKPNNGETGWGPEVNTNFDEIDSLIHGAVTFPLGPSAVNPFSATPVFDLSSKSVQYIKLTADVTSSSVTGARDGQAYVFIVEQDSVGGHAFAFPANFKNAGQINPTALDTNPGTVGVQMFVYVSATNVFYAVTPLFYA